MLVSAWWFYRIIPQRRRRPTNFIQEPKSAPDQRCLFRQKCWYFAWTSPLPLSSLHIYMITFEESLCDAMGNYIMQIGNVATKKKKNELSLNHSGHSRTAQVQSSRAGLQLSDASLLQHTWTNDWLVPRPVQSRPRSVGVTKYLQVAGR